MQRLWNWHDAGSYSRLLLFSFTFSRVDLTDGFCQRPSSWVHIVQLRADERESEGDGERYRETSELVCRKRLRCSCSEESAKHFSCQPSKEDKGRRILGPPVSWGRRVPGPPVSKGKACTWTHLSHWGRYIPEPPVSQGGACTWTYSTLCLSSHIPGSIVS